MKKRILSLLLIAIMIIAAIPATAMLAFASDEAAQPVVYDYEHYKDLWVQDGLYAFVDMTGINADNTGSTTDGYDADDKYVAGTENRMNYGGKRSYIKITGGDLAGYYFMLGVNQQDPTAAEGGTITVTDDGRLLFTTQNKSAEAAYEGTGIFIGAYFTDENGAEKLSSNHQAAGGGGDFGIPTDFYYANETADANGKYGEYGIYLNAQVDLTKINGFLSDTDSSAEKKIYQLSGMPYCYFGSATNKNSRYLVIRTASTGGVATFNALSPTYYHNQSIYTVQNIVLPSAMETFYTSSYTTARSDSGSAVITVGANGAVATTGAGGFNISADGFNMTVKDTIDANTGTYTSACPIVNASGIIYNSIKIYKRALSTEEIARNHFADLVYNFKIELSEAQINFIKDNAGKDFYAQFASYYFDGTEATENTAIALIDKYASEENVWHIENYRNVYSQMDKLYAEIDFTAINADTIGTYSDLKAGATPLYVEPDAGAALHTHRQDGTHAYVRITDGKAAGDYFMVYNSSHNQNTTPYTATGVDNIADDHPFLNVDGTYKAGTDFNSVLMTGFRYTSARVTTSQGSGGGWPNFLYSAKTNSAANLGAANSDAVCNASGTGYTFEFVSAMTREIGFQNTQLFAGVDGNIRLNPVGNSRAIYNGSSTNMASFSRFTAPVLSVVSVGTFATDGATTANTVAYVNGQTLAHEGTAYAATVSQPGAWSTADLRYGMYVPYYVRIYLTDLTASEVALNNFVDISRFYGASTELYRNASVAEQKLIVDAFAGKQIGMEGYDSKDAVEAKIAEVIDAADSMFSFVGFQARVSKNVGIRSVYAYDTTKAAAFTNATVVAYGAMVGVESFENLTVTFDGTAINAGSNAYVADIVADDNDGFKSFEELERFSVLPFSEDTTTVFAYTVDYINGSIDVDGNVDGTDYTERGKDTLFFFRGFVVIELNGEYLYLYDNGASDNYQANGGAVSLVDVCNYYRDTEKYPEYADNASINHPFKDEE